MRRLAFLIPLLMPIKSEASLSILLYHHLGYKPVSTSITEEQFIKQMNYLADPNNKFKLLTANELNKKLLSGFDFSKDKYIAITFDDGWKTQKRAAEIMAERKIPAIFFVNGEPIEKKFGAFLKVEDLIEISKNPLFDIADHSYTHKAKILLGGGKGLADDYAENQRFLKQYVPKYLVDYAYPYGYKNQEYTKFLVDSGVKIIHGVKQKKIYDSGKVNLTDLPRFVVNNAIDFNQFLDYVN